MIINRDIKQKFHELSNFPCWGVLNGYGSWLTFNFGRPSLDIREPIPESKNEYLRKYRWVRLQGEYYLWVEMCDWTIFQDEEKIDHNESDRIEIQKAANRLDGQILNNVLISPKQISSEFQFDLGGKLVVSKYENAKPDHNLWYLFYDDECTSFTASGNFVTDKSDYLK